MDLKEYIEKEALDLGFSAVGVARAEYDPVGHDRLLQWLSRGCQAGLKYMERATRKRYDPRIHMPDARSVIVCALNYYTKPDDDPSRGYISIYARGEDYHRVMKNKLEALCDAIRKGAGDFKAKTFVDTSPVGEKALAVKAGIGFIGRNGTLIIPKNKEKGRKSPLGSFHFLGVMMTDLDLEPDEPGIGTCGRCRKCIEACPTDAIVGDGIIDAGRCISYHNTQSKEEIPDDIARKMKNMIFGCDICQLACPYNSRPVPTVEPRFRPRPGLVNPDIGKLNQISKAEFDRNFAGTAIGDLGYEIFARNVASAVLTVDRDYD
jgi:epoxyqueuosine reductase